MVYITSAERIGMERGLERGIKKGIKRGIQQGMEKGMEKGMQQGMQRGILKGEKIVLLHLVEHKFGEIPFHYQGRIDQADGEVLLKWIDNVHLAKSIREVFETEVLA